jgi:tetratricopeptide (TPR) repeat protein
MDALRKAEEAKRQAAQKQQEIKQPEAPASPSGHAAVVENLEAFEESLEFDREISSSMAAIHETPNKSSGGIPNIEVPFDFDIDEPELDAAQSQQLSNVGNTQSDFLKTELAKSALLVEEPSNDSKNEHSAENIDYLKPDELSRFAVSARSSNEATQEPELHAKIAAQDAPAVATEFDTVTAVGKTSQPSSAGLTLEERAPAIERPSIVGADLEIHDEPEPEQTPASKISEVQAEEPVETMRALWNDEARSEFAEESRKRESARAVFNAKHKGKDRGVRKKLMAVVALLALFPLAGGGYLIFESLGMFSSGNQYNIPPGYDVSNRPAFDPLESEIFEETQLLDAAEEPMLAEVDVDVIEVAQPVEVVIAAMPVRDSAPIAVAGPVADPIEDPIGEVAAVSVPIVAPVETTQSVSQAPRAINITRTDNVGLVNPQLLQAYASYRDNDFIGARARYQQVLREKPNNKDAMLGLAAVALQLGDVASAREIYIRLLELDPRDVHARVGLLESMPASDPVMLESELRSLFAAHPEVAHLAFALGNHYAEQRRWSDAQQSYYDALLAAKAGNSGPVSPDYAFNLAVSLERLNQLRPAYTFYREALEQSAVVTPGFDVRVLRERLDALERILQ